MSIRRWLMLTTTVAALTALAACAGKSRYEVLSFFFDGVQPPGNPTVGGVATADSKPGAPAALVPTPAPERFYPHTPYRQNKCDGCHDATSGQLIQPIQGGLCLTCHTRLLEGKRYLHAPVAVGDCALCHHHHGSRFSNLLLIDPIMTCSKCHDSSDLSTGPHHAQTNRACHECHDPHGEQNRFFLKGDAP